MSGQTKDLDAITRLSRKYPWWTLKAAEKEMEGTCLFQGKINFICEKDTADIIRGVSHSEDKNVETILFFFVHVGAGCGGFHWLQ
jgi:hypothetical protein